VEEMLTIDLANPTTISLCLEDEEYNSSLVELEVSKSSFVFLRGEEDGLQDLNKEDRKYKS
jgi:hypothetical protein